MEKWLTLHNRVKLMLTGVVAAAVGQGLLVLNGAENFNVAWHLTAAALLTAVLGYLAPKE